MLKQHLREFEDASAQASRDTPAQAFRARMYFHSIYVNNKLFEIWANIFNGVDDKISKQLLRDKSTPHLDDATSQKTWSEISVEINNSMLMSEIYLNYLNEVFQLIGQARIDETKSPGREIKLYSLPGQDHKAPEIRNAR